MRAIHLLPLLGLALTASALQLPLARPRPLVIWHGMGDTAHSEGMEGFADFVRETYPGIYVHSVTVPEGGSASDESRAGWWGSGEELAQIGCDQIAGVKELEGGFDAIGFSQGGLFLRWYAQYCDGPKMGNLITFGTPHYGIAALIPCPTPPNLSCTLAARAAKLGIYTPWAQSHLVQAQYYRDPVRIDEFMEANTFLRDMNAEGLGDERKHKVVGRGAGGRGLDGVENVVAITFDNDRTVVPALSAHWATQSPSNLSEIIPLREQPLWDGDWIGLRALDQRGGLHLVHCPGQHMEIGGKDGCAGEMVRKWVGWRG